MTRMLAINTIEQRIADVLTMKREIFDAIFSEAEGPKQGGLTRDEIFGLFNLKTPKGPISKVACPPKLPDRQCARKSNVLALSN